MCSLDAVLVEVILCSCLTHDILDALNVLLIIIMFSTVTIIVPVTITWQVIFKKPIVLCVCVYC